MGAGSPPAYQLTATRADANPVVSRLAGISGTHVHASRP